MELKPGYKQTEVGVIPEDWEVKSLLQAVRIANGQVSPKVEPYKSMILVAPDHIEVSTGKLLAKVTAGDQQAISGKYLFTNGDIVYSKIRPYLRKAVLADFSGLCSADMYPLKPLGDMSSGYVFAVILGHQFSKYSESVSVRSGMPKINRTEMAAFFLPVPPLPEQKAIAEALSDMDRLLSGLDSLIAKKRDIKQATMQQLLTGKTRLPGFSGEADGRIGYKQTEVGLIPEDWEYVAFNTVCDVRDGTHESPRFYDHGVPFVTSKNISASGLDLTDVKFISQSDADDFNRRSQVNENDILLSMIGTVGSAVLVDFTPDFCIKNVALIKSRGIEPSFLIHVIKSPTFQKFLAGKLVGGIQSFISLGKLRLLRIPIPPLAEQKAIAKVLTDMDAELEALEQRRDKTRELKQAMMHELLTGRTRLV